MIRNKRRKRKIKVLRVCILWLCILAFSLCTYKVVSAFFNHDKVIQSDSESYVIPKEGIPSELANIITKNPELRKFVSEYPEKKDKKINIDIRKDMKKGEVPLFMQWDERWGYSTYGDNLMGLTGCGPTVLSMVLVYFQNDDRWNPYEVAQYAQRNKYYKEGEGTSWSFMNEGAQALGLKVEIITLDEAYIRKVLQAGNLVVLSMGPGDFTQLGHFIVLTGIDHNGDFFIHDPNRMSTTNKTWDFTTLAKQSVAAWAYYI